jgi:hypothetical protein
MFPKDDSQSFRGNIIQTKDVHVFLIKNSFPNLVQTFVVIWALVSLCNGSAVQIRNLRYVLCIYQTEGLFFDT